MVSKQGQKFLRWMCTHDKLKCFTEITQECEFEVDYSLIETLCKEGYLTSWGPPDALPPETPYDIPDQFAHGLDKTAYQLKLLGITL